MNGCLETFVVTMAMMAVLMFVSAAAEEITIKIKERKMKKMYISGPITGYETEERIEAFAAASARAEAMGYKAVNPMKDQPEGWSWEEYMRRDIEKLCKCDAIVMMRGWEHSRGAMLELEIAKALEMEVFYMVEEGVEG